MRSVARARHQSLRIETCQPSLVLVPSLARREVTACSQVLVLLTTFVVYVALMLSCIDLVLVFVFFRRHIVIVNLVAKCPLTIRMLANRLHCYHSSNKINPRALLNRPSDVSGLRAPGQIYWCRMLWR